MFESPQQFERLAASSAIFFQLPYRHEAQGQRQTPAIEILQSACCACQHSTRWSDNHHGQGTVLLTMGTG